MDRKRQAPLLPTRVLVIALCLITFAVGLLIISTTALAQDNGTGDQQPEITIVDWNNSLLAFPYTMLLNTSGLICGVIDSSATT
jgi:hypothetical protein